MNLEEMDMEGRLGLEVCRCVGKSNEKSRVLCVVKGWWIAAGIRTFTI